MPQCRGMPGQEDGRGWVWEHPHKGGVGGDGMGASERENWKGENIWNVNKEYLIKIYKRRESY